ncbi:MAG TPA: type IV toxin-antitoxin system AbiEi family antitoxin domain-containing protein [Acidimicrobiia bacterium]|jgi:predicted transcriptional regulator of viral defense system|nr:type IV toxin-antitoxin system AbiEi family antitoxin domain-containing protein [Acidimicrobiia bacterium]
MRLADTYRRRVRARALDQYGYVTTEDAADLGVPPVELRKLAARGGLEHVAYGLYRFEDVRPTRLDEFMEAVLRVGRDAYLSHDAVLALHDLKVSAPKWIRVGTPHRVRARLAGHIEVIQQHLEPVDLTVYERVPSATVARALLDCRGILPAEQLVDAADAAAGQGLLRHREANRIIAAVTGAKELPGDRNRRRHRPLP